MVLHALQEHFGYLSAGRSSGGHPLDLQPINVYELVTFTDVPAGAGRKIPTQSLPDLSCALGGSHKLHEHFCNRLGLESASSTARKTTAMPVQLEFVECLAVAAPPPVMMCNDASLKG